MEISYSPIGVVHTPFKTFEGIPRSPEAGQGVRATVEIFEKYKEGLKDLDGFSHIMLICHFHRSKGYKLEVWPPMDSRSHGLFATHSPNRPNPIGISVVELEGIEDNLVYIRNLDILDGTPLLDLKPYIPEYDRDTEFKTGWFAEAKKS
ncbi:MAG: tRNA (N6-threonylcarbamoyladenosine(37)-N6)-methyltransferase TrmO [Desulfurivibrionaceae bacterium]